MNGSGNFTVKALYKGEVYSERRITDTELRALLDMTAPIQAGAIMSAVLFCGTATVLGDSPDSKFKFEKVK